MGQAALVRVLIGTLCGGAFLLIVLIASGSELDETSGKTIGTAVALAFFSLTGVAGTNLTNRRPELAIFGYLTAAISLVAFFTMTGSIWSNDFGGDHWRPAVYTLILAFATGHTSVLLSSARPGDSDNVRLVRAGTIIALAALVAMAFVEIASPGRDVGAKPIAIVAVLYVLGTIVLVLLRRTSPAGVPAIAATPTPNATGLALGTLPVDHACLTWDGTLADARRYLAQREIEVIAGPVARLGAHGGGQSLYFRDPDGHLVELIAYR